MQHQTDRRRSCRFGNSPDCRHHAHMLSILFRRSDERFERRLRNLGRAAE